MRTIHSAAVLGAGTMGAQIAAHLANAGVPVLLLDLDEKTARDGLERAAKLKPAPFFTREAASLVSVGGFDTDLARIAESDWIIEAVSEDLEIKRRVWAGAAPHVRAEAIVSTNTSGIPVSSIAEALPPELRSRFLGAHFCNPPRYLPLAQPLGRVGRA